MGKTTISIENESFLINGKLTYSEINTSKPEAHRFLDIFVTFSERQNL